MAFNLSKNAQVGPVVQQQQPSILTTKPEAAKPPETKHGPSAGSGPGGPKAPGGKKRIKDRGIKWIEHYGEKSDDLKKRFDEMIGPGAYMRWVGHDYTTDGDYFIVVGPAITIDEKKRWFAGIKRFPDDPNKTIYAPTGEYFSSSQAAFSHANVKWGVPFPKGLPNYPESILQNMKIPRHVKG